MEAGGVVWAPGGTNCMVWKVKSAGNPMLSADASASNAWRAWSKVRCSP